MPGNNFFSYNGSFLPAGTPVIAVTNRSFRYGDGLFETMLLQHGRIVLQELHMDRLFRSLSLLEYHTTQLPSAPELVAEILKLCEANNLLEKAVIRLNVFRGEGGLYDSPGSPGYVIETSASKTAANLEGLHIGICHDAIKTAGIYSGLKSNSFQPYTIAALYSAKKNWDDSLVLNQYGRVCEATIANVFCIKDNIIYTPPLAEGCIEGVARRYLLHNLPLKDYDIREAAIEVDFLKEADEIFLTNVVRGIRPVITWEDRQYKNNTTRELQNWWREYVLQ